MVITFVEAATFDGACMDTAIFAVMQTKTVEVEVKLPVNCEWVNAFEGGYLEDRTTQWQPKADSQNRKNRNTN